jgi:single-strand DNA-binding protein
MFNKVTLIGRLGNDPEIRHLEGGVAVARISLATNEYYRDKDGNPQETTEWHNVVMWRDLAERAEKQLKKGALVFVEGKISYRKYTGQDNVERYATDIVANLFRSLERREGGGMGENRFPSAEPASMNRSGGGGSQGAPEPSVEPVATDANDLPF